MFGILNRYILFADILLYAFLHPELNRLPPLSAALSIAMQRPVNAFASYCILAALTAVVPVCAISASLVYFKRYIFSHVKSIISSFHIALELYLTYLLLLIGFCLLDAMMYLSSNKTHYFALNTASLRPKSYQANAYVFNYFNTLFFGVLTFITIFMFTELLISYHVYQTRAEFKEFCYRNIKFLVSFLSAVLALFFLYFFFEISFVLYSENAYSPNVLSPPRIFTSSLLSGALCYLYFAMCVE